MTLRLYMDVHVPRAVTEGLRRRGIDVTTSQDDGTNRWDDESLLARASELARLLFTQDEDLLVLAARWQCMARPFPGVIYAHQLGTGIGQIVDDLELLCTCATEDEVSGRVTFLPLE